MDSVVNVIKHLYANDFLLANTEIDLIHKLKNLEDIGLLDTITFILKLIS